MPAASQLGSAVDRQLLLQLGGRLKRARVKQGLTTTQMAERAGISRMTLSAVEAGEPSPTMGSYLRVMSVLEVSRDLVLVASETLQPSPREASHVPPSSLRVSVSDANHEMQDLQSLMLHEEAVRLMKKQPALIQQALDVLEGWRRSGSSHSRFLWDEWAVILHRRAWRRALAHTARSKELRQASPLTSVLPLETREHILNEVRQLKKGVPLGTLAAATSPRTRGRSAGGR
jgi:transcriptional regulator with XRE-family HTH domain